MATPKEQYEARKAERMKRRDLETQVQHLHEEIDIYDMVDRAVTALERIADALEAKP